MKDFLKRFKRSIKKSYRKIKYLDRTKARFFATLTIISVFCLYPAITYTYFVISEHLNAAVITIANLKYELTSTNTSFKNNSITLTPGQELSLELNLKSLNNMDTKYALDYLCDSPDVKVYYVEKKLQNVEGIIASLNSIIDIKIEIHNKGNTNQTITFNLKGGYLQNTLESNIVDQAPNTLKSVTYNYTGEFWGQKDKIKTVVFETEMNPKENATYTYDVSEKKNKSVMSYLVPDTEGEVTDTTTFTLYIQSNGKTIANSNSLALFSSFSKLKIIEGLDKLDTSKVTNMNGMFSDCSSLTSLDVSNFDTSNVTNMSYMFYSCSSLNSLVVGNFNTSNVTAMSGMFYYCSNLNSLDVSNFDTSKVTDMYEMFYACNKLTSLDVSNFDTSKVTNMAGMFSGCSNLTSLDISNFDTSNVTGMSEMFTNCSRLISLDVSKFDTSKVIGMSWMFSSCSSLTSLDLSNFDTSKVTDMYKMFIDCSSLTLLDLINFDTSNVTNMKYMFTGCSSLNSLVVGNFNTSNVTDMSSMFYSCSSLTSLDVSHFDTSNVINMSSMFYKCSSLTLLDVSHFDTSNVTNMSSMFQTSNGGNSVSRLIEIKGIEYFETSKVTDMGSMFWGNSSLTSLDLSNFDTSNVTNMSSMFSYCRSLTSLDLSNFDTSNVINMDMMFLVCIKLTTIITIRGTKCTQYSVMFAGAATDSGAQITVNYLEDASSLVDNMIATKSSSSNVVKNATPEPKYFITLNATSDISLSSLEAYKFTDILISTSKTNYRVSSFKLNGTLINGNTFKMPGENVTISDVVTEEIVPEIVESEHNPYPNSINNQEYLNKTWDGATSLTVVLEYQTEGTSWDWVYLYDKNNTAYGKYGGTTLKTETITIPGDALRIVFRTDGSGNSYYGFKATIAPNY